MIKKLKVYRKSHELYNQCRPVNTIKLRIYSVYGCVRKKIFFSFVSFKRTEMLKTEPSSFWIISQVKLNSKPLPPTLVHRKKRVIWSCHTFPFELPGIEMSLGTHYKISLFVIILLHIFHQVTVSGVTVVITEYKPKKSVSTSSSDVESSNDARPWSPATPGAAADPAVPGTSGMSHNVRSTSPKPSSSS